MEYRYSQATMTERRRWQTGLTGKQSECTPRDGCELQESGRGQHNAPTRQRPEANAPSRLHIAHRTSAQRNNSPHAMAAKPVLFRSEPKDLGSKLGHGPNDEEESKTPQPAVPNQKTNAAGLAWGSLTDVVRDARRVEWPTNTGKGGRSRCSTRYARPCLPLALSFAAPYRHVRPLRTESTTPRTTATQNASYGRMEVTNGRRRILTKISTGNHHTLHPIRRNMPRKANTRLGYP